MDGSELLKRLASHNTLPPTIVLTAFGNIETAVQTMHQLGASWFLEKRAGGRSGAFYVVEWA
jgi:FixJ family two-component response regulator